MESMLKQMEGFNQREVKTWKIKSKLFEHFALDIASKNHSLLPFLKKFLPEEN
jgi:hypothetical protein